MRSIEGLILNTWLWVSFGVFGGILWLSLAPIESASIAPGSVIASSNLQMIEHLEGGVIEEIHVDKGSFVKKGDPILKLDQDTLIAEITRINANLTALRIKYNRIGNEINEESTLSIPQDIELSSFITQQTANQQTILTANLEFFKTRRSALFSQLDNREKEVSQLQLVREQLVASTDSLNEEHNSYEALFKTGGISKTDLMQSSRRVNESRSRLLNTEHQILETSTKIDEIENQIAIESSERLSNLALAYEESFNQILELQQQKLILQQQLERTLVSAPIDGYIVEILESTIGGVIVPGSPFITISPHNPEMLIEGLVSTIDIDAVHVGQSAKIRLLSFDFRDVPALNSEVVHVSADRVLSENGEYYGFEVRLRVTDNRLDQLEVQPGMPAEIMIIGERKTVLGYLLSPLLTTVNRSMREG